MQVRSIYVHDVDPTVAGYVTLEVDLDIPGNVIGADDHGILAGDVIVLHHPESISTGRNASDRIGSGISLDDHLVICFGVAFGDQLKNDIIGLAVEAGDRAADDSAGHSIATVCADAANKVMPCLACMAFIRFTYPGVMGFAYGFPFTPIMTCADCKSCGIKELAHAVKRNGTAHSAFIVIETALFGTG